MEGLVQKGFLTLDSRSSVYYLYTTHSIIELSLLLRLACDTQAVLQYPSYLSGLRALALSHGRYLPSDSILNSNVRKFLLITPLLLITLNNNGDFLASLNHSA